MDIKFIKEKVFDTVGFRYCGEIAVKEYDGVYAALKNGVATVGANDAAGLARAYFLFAKSAAAGAKDFEIFQKRHFKEIGVMLDMSRNGVMKTDAVKRYMEYMACLGMNYLMLYTEDTYEIKTRPHFGYMRGRYSADEIGEIDEYAKKLGIELIPCIQTLGHLSQFLKWGRPTWELRDTENVLLVGSEDTYKFIEEEIAACRDAFSSKQIHIGMDEAWDIGTGKYFWEHGFMTDKYEQVRAHLARVLEICRKYGFEPMMWGDMLFRAKSKNGLDYYNWNIEFTKEDMAGIEDVGLIYWDYNQPNAEQIRGMIRAHKRTGNKWIFAEGIIPYMDMMYNVQTLLNTVDASMKISLEEGLDNLMITTWGDDGCETNMFYNLPFLPAFTEYCYRGEDCTRRDIEEVSTFLTGVDFSDSVAMHNMFQKRGDKEIWSKGLFYGDPLYELGPDTEDCDFLYKLHSESAGRAKECMEKYQDKAEWFKYVYLLYKILAEKAELRINLRKRYREDDREYIKKACDELLPTLKTDMCLLKEVWRAQWYSTYKPYGFEVLLHRLAGMIERIEDSERILADWLSGKTEAVDELEQEWLPTYRITQQAKFYLSPSNIF